MELGCCCRPTPPSLFGGVLPYFEVMGHPVPLSWLGFKCPDCFIWTCSYIAYPSKMKGPFTDNCLKYFYIWLAFLMAGCVECIRRALVLSLVIISGTAIEQPPFVGPRSVELTFFLRHFPCPLRRLIKHITYSCIGVNQLEVLSQVALLPSPGAPRDVIYYSNIYTELYYTSSKMKVKTIQFITSE